MVYLWMGNELHERGVPYGYQIDDISGHISYGEVITFLRTRGVDFRHMLAIKRLTTFGDDEIADWLNINVKTLRQYRKPEVEFKENLQEHVLLLISLFKHGEEVFGSGKNFDQWLGTPNFFFDQRKPSTFLNTVTGIMFVDDRLTGMEYGDNA